MQGSEILCKQIIPCWDTTTSSQVSNSDGAVLKIYSDHQFQ